MKETLICIWRCWVFILLIMALVALCGAPLWLFLIATGWLLSNG